MPLLSETPTLGKIYVILEAPGWSDWMPGPILGRGGRRVAQTSGEILHAHIYRNEEQRQCGLFLGSILFRLVAPPLQPRVVGSYLVRGVWFPNHLPLEGTSRIQNFRP
jgi:hypothetical protein